ncbi:hypothetical protein GXW78_11505 [Roseomonas terrae]|jgi:hypothetical protein|uniref:Uncharacterized protein n=1 Tax=Neoroseomonas terrae TaxID=424799 RepID=A0ABS5EGZ9_9PROT|nr:hypothetical protein [Neoroseomonas terrae]MBR0650290.1 hypothetical protein [Neoroseomonas terrae]
MGAGRDDVSAVLHVIAWLFAAASGVFALAALVAAYQAVRIGGARLLFNGWDWFFVSSRVPEAARPHMRATLKRWCYAIGCLMLAAIAGALSA